MDTGSSTCFLGDVVDVGFGAADGPRGEVMTAAYFRAHIPSEWREDYVRLLGVAQRAAERTSRPVKPVVWRELGAGSGEP
jgi:hypothetical protein